MVSKARVAPLKQNSKKKPDARGMRRVPVLSFWPTAPPKMLEKCQDFAWRWLLSMSNPMQI